MKCQKIIINNFKTYAFICYCTHIILLLLETTNIKGGYHSYKQTSWWFSGNEVCIINNAFISNFLYCHYFNTFKLSPIHLLIFRRGDIIWATSSSILHIFHTTAVFISFSRSHIIHLSLCCCCPSNLGFSLSLAFLDAKVVANQTVHSF